MKPTWMPIASAPLDGSEVLLGWFDLEGLPCVRLGHWDPALGRWTDDMVGSRWRMPTSWSLWPFDVWSYRRPTGHSKSGARHRGETPSVTEWAYAAIEDHGGVRVLASSRSVPGFKSRKAAIDAAMVLVRAAVREAVGAEVGR